MRAWVLVGLVLVGVVLAGCAALSRLPFSRECPSPDAWRLQPMANSALQRLEPACAREGLEKATVFYLARRLGYTPDEARQRVGVTIRHQALEATVPAVLTGGPQPVGLGGPWGLLLADFRMWTTDFAAAPVGCFTPTPEARPLAGYKMACWTMVVSAPQEWYAFLAPDRKVRVRSTTPSETWFLWGVGEDGVWTLLGGMGTPEPPTDVRARRQTLQAWAEAFGVRVLDPSTVERAYGLPVQAPPADARTWPDGDAALTAFAEALKARTR